MNKELAKTVAYGKSRGWCVRVHKFWFKPKHWTHTTFGMSTWTVRVGKPMAETAYVRGHDHDEVPLILCHEYGHLEQAEETGYSKALGNAWEREHDAWERGLRIAGELGLRVDKALANTCLGALLSYSREAQGTYSANVVGYLQELAREER